MMLEQRKTTITKQEEVCSSHETKAAEWTHFIIISWTVISLVTAVDGIKLFLLRSIERGLVKKAMRVLVGEMEGEKAG